MEDNVYFLVFELEHRHVAIPLEPVERVVEAAALAEIPQGPALLLGLLNLSGEIIPVVDIRRLLRMPGRAMALEDRIIVCRVRKRCVGFVADAVAGVVCLSAEQVRVPEQLYPDLNGHVFGVSELNGETLLIYDVEILLPEAVLLESPSAETFLTEKE